MDRSIRAQLEAVEAQTLSPLASLSARSQGRLKPEAECDLRPAFQHDRDRILHSKAFRRLKHKSQVFLSPTGDHYRTRLTHTLEVAQIGRTISKSLRLNEDLTEAIALAHDLGHTPFGHSGQDALNECMSDHGGFEHNLQSLRVVDVLEERYAEFPGLNLTFESREGILKHCAPAKARELGEVGERFLGKGQPSLEAQLANVADEIAYNNHDVDDGLRQGLIEIDQLMELSLFARQYGEVASCYSELPVRRQIHETIRRMINYLVVDLIETSTVGLREAGVQSIDEVRASSKPLITHSPGVREESLKLKRFLRHNLYNHYRVRRMTLKAAGVIRDLFTALCGDHRLLPPQYQDKVAGIGCHGGSPRPHRGRLYRRDDRSFCHSGAPPAVRPPGTDLSHHPSALV
jgi:dGTPase